MEAIILAGGLGTRLRSVVSDVPKPMAPVPAPAGRPFIAHQIQYWSRQGVTRFILSVGYKWETFQTYFGNNWHGSEIVYAVESEPLGTGGGLCLASRQLVGNQPYLVLNGDTFFNVRLPDLIDFHSAHKADATLVLAKVENNTRYGGITLSEGNRVFSLRSAAPGTEPASTLINGGVYLFARNLLESFGEVKKLSLEDQLFPELLAQNKSIVGMPSAGEFLDIGIPEDYHAAPSIMPLMGLETNIEKSG